LHAGRKLVLRCGRLTRRRRARRPGARRRRLRLGLLLGGGRLYGRGRRLRLLCCGCGRRLAGPLALVAAGGPLGLAGLSLCGRRLSALLSGRRLALIACRRTLRLAGLRRRRGRLPLCGRRLRWLLGGRRCGLLGGRRCGLLGGRRLALVA
jgi:hypothetical protein